MLKSVTPAESRGLENLDEAVTAAALSWETTHRRVTTPSIGDMELAWGQDTPLDPDAHTVPHTVCLILSGTQMVVSAESHGRISQREEDEQAKCSQGGRWVT